MINTTKLSKKEKQDIIAFIIGKYAVSGYEISKNTGISEAGIGKIINGKTKNPRKESIDKIWNYLVVEYKYDPTAMEGKSLSNNYTVEKKPAKYGDDTVTQIAEDRYMEVEFRDLSVAGGPLNRAENYAKKTMLVPREYDNGEYLVVRVDGPSMFDGSMYSIPDGANILIKRYYLNNGEKLPIRDNLFVVDAKEGQALKQIIEHNTEEGYIICHSYNPDYSDYRVDLTDVIGFYIYRKIVGYRPPVRGI